MRIRVFALAAATLGVGLPATGFAAHSARVPTVSAKLRGSLEVPKKGAPRGSGTAVIKLDAKTGKACWTITVRGLGRDKLLSAHVHKARPGKTGRVVIPLGARFSRKGCVTAPTKTIRAVARNPRAYYVNVHTRKYLDGAIRGQLHS